MWPRYRNLFCFALDRSVFFRLSTPIVSLCVYTVWLIAPIPATAQSENASPLANIMETLKKDEQQLVKEALKEHVADNVLSKDDQAFANGLIEDGKNIMQFSEQIADGDFSGVNAALAKETANQLAKQIEARYPDPDSPVRQVLSSVQNNTDTYRKLAAAALNTDPDMARVAITDALKEHANEHLGDLINQGTDFWKGMVRDVVPGSEQMGEYGVDPVDIYLQGVENWADFVRRAKRGQEIFVFDCLHRRYKKVILETSEPDTARDAVESLGLRSFDCVAEREADMPDLQREPTDNVVDNTLRGISDMYRGGKRAAQRITTDTTTLADFGMSRREVVDLIEEFERLVREGKIPKYSSGGGFHNWIKDRILDNVRTRVTRVRQPVVQQQEKAASENAEAMRRVVEALAKVLPEVLRAALGERRLAELTGLPVADHLPEGEVDTFADGRKKEEAQKKKDKKKKQEQAVKDAERELECNPEYQAKAKNGNLDDGFIAQQTAAEGPNYVDKEGCRPYGPVVAKRFSYLVPEEPATAKKNSKTASRCDAFTLQITAANTHYATGKIEQAKGILSDVSTNLAKLPDPKMCTDVRERVLTNINKVERIQGVLDRIDQALTACEPRRLGRQANLLERAANQILVTMRERIERAKPVAQKYTLAKEAYFAGDIGRSRHLFEDALKYARDVDGESCSKIEDRIGNNLRRISRLEDFDNATANAINNCDMQRITRMMKGLEGTTNPFLDNAYDRLTNMPDRCQHKLANAACQKSFGSNATAGSTEKRDDGGYSCQCRSGYQWEHSDSDSGTNSCISTAAVNQSNRQAMNANCREKFGSGYYAGPANKKGSYYCRPTKSAANSWCNRNNKGRGWYAGKINSKGGYSCYSSNRKTAKRKVRSKQKVYRPRKTRTNSGRVAKRPRYRKPRYDPKAAAAAAAAAGIILQGIQSYNRSKRRRGGGGGGGCAANPRAPGC